MRSAIITSSIFLQLAFPITALSYHPNTLQYDDRYQQSFYVPLPRKRRESVDPDDPENWHIPDDYEKEVSDLIYYQMNVSTGPNALKDHFVDLDQLLTKPGVVGNSSHPLLFKSYRRAVGAKLTFQFPFYGHLMNNLTIATGGFIYIGEESHPWLAATQYIAPLMANFDTNLTGSKIIWADDGQRIIIEWRMVQLREKTEDTGAFTFQVTLHKNGDIVFAYKAIPMDVLNISSINHPVKFGISDAYLYTHLDAASTSAPKRVIYEYHRIEVPANQVTSNTVVYLTAQPTCMGLTSCDACSNASLKYFNCSWCHNSKKDGGSFCTDEAGMHRKRQTFIEGNCMEQAKNIYCGQDDEDQTDGVVNLGGNKHSRKAKTPQRSSGSGVALLVFIFGLSFFAVGWLSYAYYNPHTIPGQFLIRYRPSRFLRIPHGNARYTASVHM